MTSQEAPNHPEPPPPDGRDAEQMRVTRRYDRMAWLYDVYDTPMEWMGTRTRRQRLPSKAAGRVLEVGVGTGRNLSHYQEGVRPTGIDVSEGMLTRPRRRADRPGIPADLESVDVPQLPYRFRANRRPEDNVAAAGLRVVDIRREGLWREIPARPFTARAGNRTRGLP